ncbi:MAG: HlyC/CorC family transporter [Alphaproteobacteria bacterium]|nr:HlyC/CorC family transporter [Alphaproteobacteria bacterium]
MSDSPRVEDGESFLIRSLKSLLRSLGVGRDETVSLREELLDLIRQHEGGEQALKPEERVILMNLIRFGQLRVDDVMLPRADIVAIDATTPLVDLVRIFREQFHSRLPVYRSSLDNILGLVHVKDLLVFWTKGDGFDLRKIVREVLFCPHSMPVLDLFVKMRQRRIHMAIVVDEYGGTDGLVTIEDLVEAIVGEIEDEHDEVERPLITETAAGMFDVDGRALLADLEARLGVDLLSADRDESVETVAGAVAALAGRVPQRGEVISHALGTAIEVVEADARRVRRVRVRRATTTAEPGSPEAGPSPAAE